MSFLTTTLQTLRSFMAVDSEDGTRWLLAADFMSWLCNEENMIDPYARRELCKQAIAVFREDGLHRPPFAVLSHHRLNSSHSARQHQIQAATSNISVMNNTPSIKKEASANNETATTEFSNAIEAQSPQSSVTVMNLHGFLYFVRALKVLTSGYTVIDKLYACCATLGPMLFAPPSDEIKAYLELPPQMLQTTSFREANHALPGTTTATPSDIATLAQPCVSQVKTPLPCAHLFVSSLPAREPAPNTSSMRYHPYTQPNVGAQTARPPHYGIIDRRVISQSQVAFSSLMSPLLKYLHATPVDASAMRYASLQANEALASAIISQLSKFVSSSGKSVSNPKVAVRELLGDLSTNPSLVHELRGARLSCSELMSMNRRVQVQ
jgi:hypothetical protein